MVSQRWSSCFPLDDHFIRAIDFLQPHLNALLQRRRQILADVVGFDRQLAMTAIDQHDELNRARPAEVNQRIERRPGSSARYTARRPRAGSFDRRSRREFPCGGQPAAGRPRWRMRSSRYRVMSSAPVGTSSPLISRSDRAIRRARGTPRVRMPTSAISSRPRLRSRISCAMRVSARDIRSASITCGIAAHGGRLTSHRPSAGSGRRELVEGRDGRGASWTRRDDREYRIFERGATPPARMHRSSNAVRLSSRAAKASRPRHDSSAGATGCGGCRRFTGMGTFNASPLGGLAGPPLKSSIDGITSSQLSADS